MNHVLEQVGLTSTLRVRVRVRVIVGIRVRFRVRVIPPRYSSDIWRGERRSG